jgi:para-nitrobenzyl esterase
MSIVSRICVLAFAGGLVIAGGLSPAFAADSPLAGTVWQLVRFVGGNSKQVVPDDPAKYTLQFQPQGQLFARVDCNRGRGRWDARADQQLRLDAMAVTRAMCPPGSLHDQILMHLPLVRSYKLNGARLLLTLEANGGVYEFAAMEPESRDAKQK